MNFDFDDIISAFSVLLSFLLVVYLLGTKGKKKLSNYFFAGYLIVYLIDSAAGFSAMYLYPNYPSLALIISNTIYLQPAFLFLYASSVIYSDFKIKASTLLHTIPYLIINLVLIPSYFLVSVEEKLNILAEGHQMGNWEVPVIYGGFYLVFNIYLIASFYIIFRYKRLLKENYSNPELVNQKWLLLLFIVLTAMEIIASFKNYTVFTQNEAIYKYAGPITSFGAMVFVFWLVLKAMRSPDLFMGVNSKLQLVRKIVVEDQKIRTLEQEKPEIKKLKSFMEEEEPFLDASLNMHDLATKLDFPVRELSVLINHHLNQNFFDFVNEYRINKAKKILADPEKSDLTILEVLYEVGFNSKSSFNTAFKKYTNFTPSEYRKKHLKSAA